ncbi:sensor histidine kinase [Streptomyces sp. MP131-18]|uniref:sensor histidine kinase n=1 Tax=Streptomyces sp. MP131-18 TaxID=1857892 RepID=UPI00097BE1A2|nr:sensor histidine kinase [Streptomyces sp. MP131-18]ONK11378.1 Signal-transduction histidine kinase senX3 [Streptomyces sp. MP131-18]
MRVRSRLLGGVLLTGIAVSAAGAPALHAAVSELTNASELVSDADLGRRVVSLSHVLADERDALVVALAVGDPAALPGALTDDARARADRAAGALPGDAGEQVHRGLDALPATRERALAGESTPAETFADYTALIEDLDAVFRDVSRSGAGAAGDPAGDALPDLARAVHSSSAARGLLLAGLSGEGEQAELTALAQREAVREEAALADFAATAGTEAAESYERTVTGPEAEAAEEYLAVLTDAPVLTEEDRALDPAEVHDVLLARTGQQRGVLSSLAAERADHLEGRRGDSLTDLQLTGGLVAVALLLATVVSVHTARSLTRPLAAVRLGTRRVAADPAGQDPVKFTGRNDEFAEVVASVNTLRARTVALQEQAVRAADEAAVAERDSGGLRAERDRLLAEQGELNARLAALHGAVHGMFAHHAERLLALIGEQLTIIEGLEEHETDPDRLAVLFSLDHLAARVRRHGENLLLLAGAEPVVQLGDPIPLIDVARAAVSEIELYELVETTPPPPPARLVAAAARDVSHLLAELLDNATAFSPAGTRVRLTARWAEGELLFCVEDEGFGLAADRVAELNARLADPVTPPPGADGAHGGSGIGMGLYTVARLAARHGLRCWLAARPGGGTLAQVVVPGTLVEALPETYAGDPQTTGSFPLSPADSGAVPMAVPGPFPEHARADDTTPRTDGITDSGLPRRGRAAGPAAAVPAQERARAVDAEELRRRLGGFQRGARDGHRDAAQAPGHPGEPGEGTWS